MAINGAPAATPRFSASFALATAADSLDVTVQAQVLALLVDLKTRLGLAMVFISHSLPVVAEVADREVVLYAGEAVEEGRTAAVFARPRHPYTATLLRSAPTRAAGRRALSRAQSRLRTTCRPAASAPRCGLRIPACEAARPPLFAIGEGRCSRCIRWREL